MRSAAQAEADYFNGRTSKAQAATITFNDDGSITLDTDNDSRRYTFEHLNFSSRLGDTPRTLTFSDGTSCHIKNNDIVDTHLKRFGHNRAAAILHILERHALAAGLAVIFVIAFSWSMAVYIIPASAKAIAFELPNEVNQHIGRGTLDTLDEIVFESSRLDTSIRDQLSQRFDDMLSSVPESDGYKLVFRDSKRLGANAFAIPSGIIVITDDLVELSEKDEEIMAIMAHEIGHLQHRHGLRMTMQSSAVALLIAVITGDPFSTSSLLVALPTVLLNSSYSRDFEIEADDFAYRYMKDNNIPLHHFADILERIAPLSADSEFDNYLSTHPSTGNRLQRFR